jgi:8-oxo-dGTP pyrophosphatase MutT (NUDIX family)
MIHIKLSARISIVRIRWRGAYIDGDACDGGPLPLTSCGVIVTDGPRVLLGHATRSPRWDIPKGLVEAGETFAQAAARELTEETGLDISTDDLVALGVHVYMKGKDLALFAWMPERMPDPSILVCASTFAIGGSLVPEFDRFGIFSWTEALERVGKNMARILSSIRARFDPVSI